MNQVISEQIVLLRNKFIQLNEKISVLERENFHKQEENIQLKKKVEELEIQLADWKDQMEQFEIQKNELQMQLNRVNSLNFLPKKDEDIQQIVREIEYCIDKLKGNDE